MDKLMYLALGLFFGFLVGLGSGNARVKRLREEHEIQMVQKDIEREEMRSQMLKEQTAYIRQLSERLHGKPKQ